jgi:protocatechuate 3,4-dioxygenase alpha subunit
MARRTAAQTIGPFFGFALPWTGGAHAIPEGTPRAIRVGGVISDGEGNAVSDALVESWQASPEAVPPFRGFARCATDGEGRYAIVTLKPGVARGPDGAVHAPHIALGIFARGLLKRAVTRVYFSDEPDANAADPTLARIGDAAARATLIAVPTDDGYRFDIRLQGAGETVFFDV